MSEATTDLLVALGLVLFMVLYWTYYLLGTRRTPESERWYDSADAGGAASDGALYIFPYGSLIMGAGGAAGLLASSNFPETVQTVLAVPIAVAFIIGVIGFTGAIGVPLPWPFVPRWVVDIRKTKRARRRQRREARKMKKNEPGS